MVMTKALGANSESWTKDIWHPYGLQSLPQNKFSTVVGKILNREHTLLTIESSPIEGDELLVGAGKAG